jgi:hypothetical protein
MSKYLHFSNKFQAFLKEYLGLFFGCKLTILGLKQMNLAFTVDKNAKKLKHIRRLNCSV